MRMRHSLSVMTLAVLLVLTLSVPLFAQGQGMRQGAGQGMNQGMGPGQGMQNMDRGQMRERVERYRMWRMIEELDLTPEQAAEVAAILDEEREATSALMERFQNAKQAIREELEKASPSERRLEELVGDLRVLQDEMHEARTAAGDALQDVLTPIQQAQYVLFQEMFQQELRQMMMQHRGQGGEGGPGGRGQMMRGSNERGQTCAPNERPRGNQAGPQQGSPNGARGGRRGSWGSNW